MVAGFFGELPPDGLAGLKRPNNGTPARDVQKFVLILLRLGLFIDQFGDWLAGPGGGDPNEERPNGI